MATKGQGRAQRAGVPNSVLLVKRMCTCLGLIDVWRLNHPADRDYTFYSGAHIVFSRIDFFIISVVLIPVTLPCCIDSILISDHAVVRMDMIPYEETMRSQTQRQQCELTVTFHPISH